MIVDRLVNKDFYLAADGHRLSRAFEFLLRLLKEGPADGRYDMDDEDVYALIRTYTTGDAAGKHYEAHRRYIDLQYMQSGREIVYWTPTEGLAPLGEYDADKDIVFFHDKPASAVGLEEGYFILLHPGDAHKPECSWQQPETVRKIVVKIGLKE